VSYLHSTFSQDISGTRNRQLSAPTIEGNTHFRRVTKNYESSTQIKQPVSGAATLEYYIYKTVRVQYIVYVVTTQN